MADHEDLLQKLEEKVAKAEEAYKKEVKARKEVETLNAKLLEEKTNLLKNLEGEKGELSSIQERANKLAAQKTDLESQLHVSLSCFVWFYEIVKSAGRPKPSRFKTFAIFKNIGNV